MGEDYVRQLQQQNPGMPRPAFNAVAVRAEPARRHPRRDVVVGDRRLGDGVAAGHRRTAVSAGAPGRGR